MPRFVKTPSTDPIPMTQAGRRRLEKRLHYLDTVRRKEVSEQIKEASSHGDLRENSGYEVAMQEQNLLLSEIRRIKHELKYGKLIQATDSVENVSLGYPVTVREEGALTENTEVYTIVGSAETNPGSGLISNDSPLGKALLGSRPGDVVECRTPDATLRFRILQIGELPHGGGS